MQQCLDRDHFWISPLVILLVGILQGRGVANDYTLTGCSVSASDSSTIDDGPHSSPFLTGETVKTPLTFSNPDPSQQEEVVGQLSGPSMSWSMVSVQMSDTASGTLAGANSPGDYNYSGTDPNAPSDDNSSGALGFDSANSTSTNLWGTFNSIHHFKVTVSGTVHYSDQGGNTWTGTAQTSFNLVAGNWVGGPSTLTPTSNLFANQGLDDSNLPTNDTETDPYEYGNWVAEVNVSGMTNPLSVDTYSQGFTNGETGGSITPTNDPQTGSLSEQEVWNPTDTSARPKTFEYSVQVADDVDNGSAASIDANISNWNPFKKSSGATAAGVKGSIDTDPSSSGRSTVAVAEAKHTQGSDGTIAVGIGASLWPPTLGGSVGTTFSSDTWSQSESFNPVNSLLQGSVSSGSQNHVTVKATLLASALVSWGNGAEGPLTAQAGITVSQFTIGVFQP